MNLYQKVNKEIRKYNLADRDYVDNTFVTVLPNVKNFYVGGDGASDIISKGRGETPDKPFSDLNTCIAYALSRYSGIGAIYIVLQSDIECSKTIYIPYVSGSYIGIAGNTSDNYRTLKCPYIDGHNSNIRIENLNILSTGNYSVYTENSYVNLINVNITAENTTDLVAIRSAHGSYTNLRGVNITVSSDSALGFFSVLGGDMFIHQSEYELNGDLKDATYAGVFLATSGNISVYKATFTGNVTGRRYSLYSGKLYFNQGTPINSLPGTMDGYIDTANVIG